MNETLNNECSHPVSYFVTCVHRQNIHKVYTVNGILKQTL